MGLNVTLIRFISPIINVQGKVRKTNSYEFISLSQLLKIAENSIRIQIQQIIYFCFETLKL